jgi:hypothetical protein
VTIEKFETNPILVNMNKLKPYKYMESEVQKKKTINVSILGKKSACGIQEANFDIEEDDEGCQL